MTEIPSIVILGVGNTLMQDDGVGVRTVRALAEAYEFPSHVRLVEGGTAGLRLLSELEGADYLLIIDAVSGKKQAGSIYHLTPKDLPSRRGSALSAHEIGMAELLSTVELIGKMPRTQILGVQPMEAEAVGLELSLPVQKALPYVVAAAVEELRAMGVDIKTKRHQASASGGHHA